MKKLLFLGLCCFGMSCFAQTDSAQYFKNRNDELQKQKEKIDSDFEAKMEVIEAKYQRLKKKYGAKIANKILAEETWVGMTKEMLIESQGKSYKIGAELTDAAGYSVEYRYGTDRLGTSYYLLNGKVISILDY